VTDGRDTSLPPAGGDAEAGFGLLGRTLGHSWSRAIHAQLGSVPYQMFEREPEDVEAFVREGAWRGINVTIPYKRNAARLADEATERVERLGVANTLVRRADGTILAENTDVLGFAWMLEDFCERELGEDARSAFAGCEVLVLGSGGASQAVQAAVEDATGIVPAVISRTGEDTYVGLAERHPRCGLIVNTTPVGMYPTCPATPVEEGVLAQMGELRAVLDVVYNPRRTGICLAAERLGIPCQSGLPMLVAQAVFASELFQGKELDRSLIGDICKNISRQTTNITLIGMPGCGKTTAGRKLARLLERPFFDMDDAFDLEAGMKAGDYIRAHGEEAFRAVETEVLAKYASRSGLVIACGGGVVTQPRNYDLLHQNSVIVGLERDVSTLATKGRPLSQDRGVEALAAERVPLYHAWADHTLSCTGTSDGDAHAIKDLLGF